jgi:4-hydroxy-2-oxoheptanedioate aldolase
MKTNVVRAKLKRGEPSIGTWLVLPDPLAARLIGRVGFDWLTVELEHAPINLETAAQSFVAIAAGGTVPLVRVPWNSAENIKRVLDNGAWGVIVPMVNSRAEAQAVVAAARYQPLGERSVGGQLHAVSFDTDPATYYARANDEILVVVMMEHVRAIQNADAILSVPGVDAFFIGPNDLTQSMGRAPVFESDDPEFVGALKHLREVGKKYGVASGIHVADAEAAVRRRAEGFQMIAIASEAGLMLAKACETITALGLGRAGIVAAY